MTSAETSDVFNCTPTQFFKIVSDYEKYPEFLTEVKSCKVLKTEGNRKLVEYNISLIKTFKYTLWMTEKEPNEVSWEFASGDVFKKNSGAWKMSEEGGKTRANYQVTTDFTLFVPGPIAKALVTVNLPSMMSAYQKRVAALYGR